MQDSSLGGTALESLPPAILLCLHEGMGSRELGEGGDLHTYPRLFRHILQEQGPPGYEGRELGAV